MASASTDLSLQQASKLIGVSHPTLVRLLDTGMLSFHRTNGCGDRRISRRAALDYLRADLERRHEALDVLATDAEAFGFFGH
jgi:excisionase family DNA binding protein